MRPLWYAYGVAEVRDAPTAEDATRPGVGLRPAYRESEISAHPTMSEAGMSPLIWTAAPLVVTVLAAVLVWWRARPQRPGEAIDTVEEHARFRAALARSTSRGKAPVRD